MPRSLRRARRGRPSPALARRVLAAVLLASVAPAYLTQAHAAPERTAPDDPARLVYLLEYVGLDYAQAVRDGAVVDPLEYGEVLRFTKEVVRAYAKLPGRTQAVQGDLERVQGLVERRAPADQVWSATRALLPALVRSIGGAATPATAPNLGNGRRLWMSDCAPCHGPTGGGDGPSSAGMEPPPTALRGTYLERLSPRQVYNAVTFGIEGTAMPSFAGAYDERQRWDVAFFALTQRVGFAPKRPADAAEISLEQIASSSNAELLERLRERDPGATEEHVDHLRTSFPPGERASSAAAAAGGGDPADAVAVALRLQDAFASVAERVSPRVVGVTAFSADPAWAPEKLRAERGEAWASANADALRHPGLRPQASGSGLLLDDEGYVLSRDRLVRDESGELAPLVEVELPDQTYLTATVVGSEPTLDLAVLRVALAESFAAPAALEIGDSDRLQAGHWLIALGDPPGAEATLAVGVVSAAPQRQCYQNQLSATRVQSSLVLPEGALGGPVVDVLGRVVGVSVGQHPAPAGDPLAVAPPATAHVLPINLVLNLFEALKVARSTRSPWLGVSVLERERVASRSALAASAAADAMPPSGIYVDDVFTPSPAAAAGVRPGDFLLRLGEHAIATVADFQRALYVLGIGREVTLELWRSGEPLRVQAAIEARPESATTS
jgi:S1-C subfamily serine protease